MTTSKYIYLEENNFIIVSGEDKRNFLQGIITNDINKCKEKVIYSCLLSPQGKFLSDFFIIPLDDSFLIEINKKFEDEFIKKLNLYKLRSKINIEKSDKYLSFALLANTEKNTFKEGEIIKNQKYIKYIDPRSLCLGYKIIIDKSLVHILEDNITNDVNDYTEKLINNLIPNSVNDLIINKSLLLENNFDQINAIDWKKGCFIGQEITARMKYRALLKKSIRLINIQSGNVNSGDEIYFENINVGYITSILKNRGIAMINIEKALKAIKNDSDLLTKLGKLKIIN